MSAIPSVIAALLIFVCPFLFLILLVWVPWNRYLHHKEALLLLQKGGEETGGAWYALLEMRERWRIRWGILVGVIMMALGVAIMLPAFIGPRTIGPTGHSAAASTILPLAFMGGFITIVGIILTVAHAIWARKRTIHSTGDELEKKA